ncbi:hypothetical protein PG989_010025 [Apiospora arundinis]
MSSLGVNVYNDILQWVNMQQQLEISGQPTTMTATQRKAVRDLHQLIKPRAPVMEPELGKHDWIGLLNRYRQAKPESQGIQFTDEPVEDPPAPLRWHCYCRIAEHSRPFPSTARGVDPDTGLPPSFGKKQSAKHYAAKCAVEWLVEQGLMPQKLAAEVPRAASLRAGTAPSSSSSTMVRPSSSLSASSNPSSPEAKRQKMTATSTTDNNAAGGVSTSSAATMKRRTSLADTPTVTHISQQHQHQHQHQHQQQHLMNPLTSSSQNSSASNSSGGTPIVPPSEPRTSPPITNITNLKVSEDNGGDGNTNGDGRRFTAQVADLCHALGLGAPSYEIKADTENVGYFSGHPVFQSTLEAGYFPHGTGYVENVMGKNYAKEEIAKRVLAVLRKIKQERDSVKRELMADLGPTVG